MDPKQVVEDFFAYLRKSAEQFKEFGVEVFSYADSETGVTYQGYQIEYEGYPTIEEINPSFDPIARRGGVSSKSDLYYWGGTWGHCITFLTGDGRLFEYEYRGEDVLEGLDIRTTTRSRIAEVQLGRIIAGKEPFAEIRNLIDRRLAQAYADSLQSRL